MKRVTLTRRSRLRARSRKRQRELAGHKIVREAVFERDGYECQFGRLLPSAMCGGRLTFHHRRKASQGGGYTLANGLAACCHCNERAEFDAVFAAQAHEVGLVVRRGDPGYELLGAA